MGHFPPQPELLKMLTSTSLKALLCLLIVLASMLTFSAWKSLSPDKRYGRKTAWMALGSLCVLAAIDWGLLAALPRLGLSFGPVGPSLAIAFVFRLLPLILLAATLKYSGKLWPAIRSRAGLACGVLLAVTLNLGLSVFLVESTYRNPSLGAGIRFRAAAAYRPVERYPPALVGRFPGPLRLQ